MTLPRPPKEILERDEWRARYVRYCPTCKQDTLPRHNGTCGFCDTVITAPEPTEPPEELVDGERACERCGQPFVVNERSFPTKRFCSSRCQKQHWVSTSPAAYDGRSEYNRRRNERRRMRYRIARAMGLDSRAARDWSSAA